MPTPQMVQKMEHEVWINNNGSNKVTARFNENSLLLEDMTLRFR